MYQAVFKSPVQNQRILYYENLIPSDSGNPAVLLINEQPVVLIVWTYGDGGSGTSIVEFKDDLNQMISDLNAACDVTNEYQLMEIDLSMFDKLDN